ncbi:unnamed protein product, partial [Brassica oleracea var. botrytis]
TPVVEKKTKSFDSSPLPLFLCSSLSLPLYRFVSVSLIGPPFGSLFQVKTRELLLRVAIVSRSSPTALIVFLLLGNIGMQILVLVLCKQRKCWSI